MEQVHTPMAKENGKATSKKGIGREAIFMDTVLILVLMGISLWANGKIMF